MRNYIFLFLAVQLAIPAYAFAQKAEATLSPTDPTSSIKGLATFEERMDGVEVIIKVENVSEGKHGIHIHEGSSCDDKGNAAGGHFNPLNAPHGYLFKDGQTKAHAGDFGNILVNSDGTGTLNFFLPGYHLNSSEAGLMGRTIILHEKEDDFGQPTGNAGGRIACGIIQ